MQKIFNGCPTEEEQAMLTKASKVCKSNLNNCANAWWFYTGYKKINNAGILHLDKSSGIINTQRVRRRQSMLELRRATDTFLPTQQTRPPGFRPQGGRRRRRRGARKTNVVKREETWLKERLQRQQLGLASCIHSISRSLLRDGAETVIATCCHVYILNIKAETWCHSRRLILRRRVMSN